MPARGRPHVSCDRVRRRDGRPAKRADAQPEIDVGPVEREALVEPSRAEEGVLVYIPNRDPEDSTKFFIYEQYVDEAAYTAHTETEHFKKHGFGDAIPRLQERKREFYSPMTD